MRKKMIKLAAMMLSAVMIMSGCGGADGKGTGKTPRNDGSGELRIVTSFFPVYVAVINVTRDISGISVTNMTEPQTGCLHDYSLKPDDLKLLEDADIFIINGAGMEAFLDDVMRQQNDLRIIEAAGDIEVLMEESGEANPHVWVSVTNAISYVQNIADRLSEIDEKNAEQYRSNAASYIGRLEALKDEMHSELDGLKMRDIITFHEAFPYFAEEFDLNIAAVVEREPGTEPTQKELAAIIGLVRETGIKALFAEPQYSSRVADAIASDTGAVVYTLDPVVTGEAVPEAADAYLDAMRRNMETLKKALG
jgi:zinc transport system substrate-binding protein